MSLAGKRAKRRDWVYAGRRALVTGASAGLGTEFAWALARRGMALVLSARRGERLDALARSLRADHGVAVDVVPADLAEADAAKSLWESARRGGEIDLLVNNAGFGAEGEFTDIPLARQKEMVQVNCVAPLELAWLAAGEMARRGGGGIINVSSIAAFQPVPHLATYAASKAFLLSLSEAIDAETRPAGVRTVALCPGRTPTEFQAIAGSGSAEGAFGARSPEYVVEAGLRALERGDTYSVPGQENFLATLLVRVLPRSAVTRAVKGLVRRAASKG